eukprot:COSAG01_NODE_1778_length_9259_cov_4.593668_5_plen_37_part_00
MHASARAPNAAVIQQHAARQIEILLILAEILLKSCC